MSEIIDGGPAFPVQEQVNVHGEHVMWAESGMTLRDYFAAKAMQSIVLRPCTYEVDTIDGIEATAGNAYDIADAMLKARGQS